MSNLVRKYRKLLIFILFIVFTISTLGIINTKAAEKIFRITSATILDKSDTVEADVISFNEDDININSTFHQLDDFITYKLVIKNTSKKKYTINNISIDNSSPYLEVSYDQIEDKEISPNESFEVDVNVVYKNEVTDLTQRNSDDTFKLYLDYEDEKGVKGDTENPKTGDNIKIYIALAVLSLSGIIILSIKRKKLKKVLVVAVLFTPFIGNALTSKIVFKFNSNTKLMDKIIVTQKVGDEETEVVIPYNTNPEKPSDPNKDGYNFEGWYINEDKYNFDRPLKEDEVIEAKFSLINYSITYNLDGGTITGNKTSYNVETDTFTLVKPTKEGYNFSGWTGSNGENLQPVVTINKGTTGDKIYTAHYSEREDTKYTVYHEYEELNGTFTTETEEGEGVTASTIYPEVHPRVGYNTPQTKPLEIAPDGSANITYTYLRKELTLTYSDTTNMDLSLSSSSGTHKYGEQIKVVAKEIDGYTFSKWSDNSTDLTHTFTMTDSITIYPIYSVNSYTVTFDADNDTTNSTVTRNYNTKVGELPVPEKENYVFDGWYTSDNTKITKDTIITGDITFYAHWNKSVYFLNIEDTNITLTNHDTASINITNSDEIGEEYTFTSNDEDVVTVNSDGVITTTGVGTTTITIKGNTSNIEKTINVTVNAKKYTVTFDSNGGNNISSVEVEEGTSLSSIPEPTKENYIFDGWYNGDNKLTTSTKINDDITYTAKWNKSVYFLNIENTDITITNHDTANITITNSDEIGEEYTFTSNDPDVATVNSDGVITTTRVGTTTITVKGNDSNKTKTINVTVIAKKVTVSFNADGGTQPSSVEVDEGSKLESIPTSTKDNYLFDGWYLNDNKLTTDTTINEDVEYKAKWNKSVYFLNIENTDITITNHDTASINITNSDDIGEEYTFTSNDEDVVTVNSEGLITTTGVGTTTITVKGNTSNIEKTINVTVNAKKYTVTFDSNGGNNISSVEVEEGSTLDSIPTPEKEGFTFDGWYNEDNKLTTSTKINDDITYTAHWTEVENNDFVCYRATKLHSDTCSRTDSSGCVADGYIDDNSTVTFGKIPTTGSYKVGDAFDCDINGNGEIDEDSNGNSTERFYYLRTTDDNKMVFTYYSNTVNGISDNTKTYAYTTDGKNYSQPTTLLSHLPNKTVWNNVSIDSEIQLYNENSETTAGGYNLPALDYSNYSSRMITLDDLEIACNIDVTTSSQEKTIPTGSNGCQFLFENTTYVNPNIKSGYWVATALSNSTTKMFRTVGSRHTVESKEASSSTGSGIRPVIEVPVDKVETPLESNTYTVTFNSVGGSNVPPMEVNKNSSIGTLPTEPTKSGYNFIGWYTDTYYTTEVTEETIITEDTTIYAKWLSTNAVAEYKNEGYNSINSAISAVKDSNTASIKLLKNTSEKVTVPSGRDIQLDLNGKTISVESDMNVVANSGTLKIYNGTLTTTAPKNAAINNNNGGVLYLNDIEIHGNGSRSTIYNYGGGTVYIDKNSYLKAYNDQRASIVNLANGTIYIYGGTIESTQKEGIDNAGNLIIGIEDGISNSESPIIQGIEYGIKTTTNISFYDGIIKGKTDYINDRTKITDKEENHQITTTIEDIASTTYTAAYLSVVEGKILVYFDTKGGELENTTLLLDVGDSVGILPIPTKGIYTFDGWYLDEEYNTRVLDNTIPDSNVTYYAKWSYNSSNEVVDFDATSDVMSEYYNKLSLWSNDESTFQNNMVDNFNDYSCQCTDNTCSTTGTVLCDKPKGYDTGVNGPVDVYLYDTYNNTKGNKVSYAKGTNGIIYNLIPDQVYYWELQSDSNIYGYVRFTNDRRIIDAGAIRNVRDLGGLSASYIDKEGNSVTGHTKYEKLFRGVKIGTNANNKTELTNLGINEEVDLRANSEISSSNDAKLDNFKAREIKHYQIDRATYLDNYTMTRNVVKEVMTDVVNGNSIYFHCRIGTDRTGTLAYILEGLLGVDEELRLEDYELSFFYGLINRHRYYSYDASSSVSKTEKFGYMRGFLNTNQSIYEWYMAGTDNEQEDIDLIDNFRKAMIEKD